MTKTEIEKIINDYCKTEGISKKEYNLFPLYAHFDGFSHSMGFIDHKANKNIREHDYTSVGYSNYMSDCEGKCWGYENEHQKKIVELIFSNTSHLFYQNNAKEILF